MNEHNLKLITEALKDFTESTNEEVRSLCFQIMANLCLDNEAAKYLISRTLKTTRLRDNVTKLPDNLVSFKFYLVMEDEILPKDGKYFMKFAIQALQESIETFKLDSARHALDIVKHYRKRELPLEFDVSNDEEMSELTESLIDKMSKTEVTPAMRKFYDSIFQFFSELVAINYEFVKALVRFVDIAFTTATLCKSSQALNLLKTYVQNNGTLRSPEIVIENLLNSFIGHNEDDLNDSRKCAFLQLLETLETKEKLSDLHYVTIGEYFDKTFDGFNTGSLPSMNDDDCFAFVYFLSALSSFGNKRASFHGKLNEILKRDFLPLLIVRAHLSRKEEILLILFKLASVPNFPNQKIASILSKNGTSADGKMTQAVLHSLERRAIQTTNTRFFTIRLTEDLDALIAKVNAKVDGNELGGNTADVVQLYRHKISHLTDQLSSVTASLDRCASEMGELQQNFTSFMKMSEKQEFANWCLQLDNDRLKKELYDVAADNKRLKLSLSDFQAIVNREELARLEVKKTLKLKLDEVTSKREKVPEKCSVV